MNLIIYPIFLPHHSGRGGTITPEDVKILFSVLIIITIIAIISWIVGKIMNVDWLDNIIMLIFGAFSIIAWIMVIIGLLAIQLAKYL